LNSGENEITNEIKKLKETQEIKENNISTNNIVTANSNNVLNPEVIETVDYYDNIFFNFHYKPDFFLSSDLDDLNILK